MANHKRVERLMADNAIVGHHPRKRRSLTEPDEGAPPLPDLVGRLFDPDEPDDTWVGDIERHEALCNRAVMKGHRLRAVAAVR